VAKRTTPKKTRRFMVHSFPRASKTLKRLFRV
jgi:hypothetical protein